MAHGAPDHRLVIDLVELVKLIQTINTIDEVTKISLIDAISSVTNISSVDLIDLITNISNVESIDLIDRITRIDAIDSVGEISIGRVVPLISPPLLILDQFDSGLLKWVPTGDGRLELSNERAFSGSGSMRIYTGPSTGKAQTAWRYFAVSADLTMRLVHRLSSSSTGVTTYYSVLTRYTGSQRVQGSVRYLPADEKWQYQTGEETWADIPDGAQRIIADPNIWHHITLECDFSTKKFVQLKVDALTIDMSTLDMYVSTDERSEYAEVFIGIEASAGNIVEAYVDDVLVEAW